MIYKTYTRHGICTTHRPYCNNTMWPVQHILLHTYHSIMDDNICREIKEQLLSRFPSLNCQCRTSGKQFQPSILPNRRTPPPQDWLLLLKSRLNQQIRCFISTAINPNTTMDMDHNTNYGLDTNSTDTISLAHSNTILPPLVNNMLNGFSQYRDLFKGLLPFKQTHPQLIYRTAKFLATCHGLIWILNDSLPDTDEDIDPQWLFFISLAYAIIDTQADSAENNHIDGQKQTQQLFNHLDTLFQSNTLHDISPSKNKYTESDAPIMKPIMYLDELYQQNVMGNICRQIAAKRALECEKQCWTLQQLVHNSQTPLQPDIAATLLIEKAVSTIQLIYCPRRNASIQIWRRLYWTAVAIQLLDDMADVTEDIEADLSGTTGLAMCHGNVARYIAGVLDTVSYIYYNYEIFAGRYYRIAVLHQLALYGIIKNIGSEEVANNLPQQWISRHVMPGFILDLGTLYKMQKYKANMALWFISQL